MKSLVSYGKLWKVKLGKIWKVRLGKLQGVEAMEGRSLKRRKQRSDFSIVCGQRAECEVVYSRIVVKL